MKHTSSSPTREMLAQHLNERRVNVDSPIPVLSFDGHVLPFPHATSNTQTTAFKFQIVYMQTENLTGA